MAATLLAIAPATAAARARQPETTPAQQKSSVQGFSNFTPISVGIGVGAQLPATPYPSTINVSGITSGAVTKVEVQLNGLTHSYPADLDVLLVGPGGERVMLMSDAGGSTDVAGINLTFSATASNAVPLGSLSTATVRPANYVSDENPADFSDPFTAPTVLDLEPADLTVFSGTDPNGVWSLYVSDDFPTVDGGAFATGWALTLTVPTLFTVTTTADTADGTCDEDCSLREALAAAAANADNGDLIRFASPLFDSAQTITLGGTELVVFENTTIQGPGAAKLTISGGNVSRVFFTNPGVALSLSGMTLTGGRIQGNPGGAIISQGPLSLRNVAIAGNQSVDSSGGGLFQLGATLNLVGCTISDNRADGAGGAFEFESQAGPAALRIANSTISGNTSGSDVGGFDVFHVVEAPFSVEIVDSTIVDNRGVNYGGIELYTQGGAGATVNLTLRNSIVANNAPSNIGSIVVGGGPITVGSQGFNLTDDAVPAYTALGSDKVGLNPRLGPLNNNGGQLETHALLGGSPAIDAGQRSGYVFDARGQVRASNTPNIAAPPGGDDSDIGAVEMITLLVTNTADSGAGSLRDAIAVANLNPDQDDIVFDDGFFGVVPQTIQLASALPAITSNLSISGPGAKLLTVRRDTGGDYRILNSPNVNRELALSGLTISNGRAPDIGGGIYSLSRIALAEVAISGNTDLGVIGGGGLALAFNDGTIRNSTISGNDTNGSGGGIYFQGFDDRLRVVNTTISGNHADVDSGAMLVASQDGQRVRAEVIDSTIAGNTAPAAGGLYAFTQGNLASVVELYLRNSIAANNTAPNLIASSFGGSADIVSLGYNLSNDPTPAYLDLASDKFNTNPQIGPLADNGGPTRTHALLPGSPALDAGDWSGSAGDQRHAPRPNDLADIPNNFGNAGYDIGAVEDDTLFRNGFE